MNAGARPARGNEQRRRKLAVVDLMILGCKDRARELAGKVRLALARLGRGNPPQRQIKLPLELEMMEEPRLIVRGERDHQRPLAPQVDIDAGGLLEFFSKARPARLALAPKRD